VCGDSPGYSSRFLHDKMTRIAAEMAIGIAKVLPVNLASVFSIGRIEAADLDMQGQNLW
jgi:hypothetical protein